MRALTTTDAGLYCEAGDFHIDPWKPVPRAVVTHAHSDHARPGCGAYLTSLSGLPLLRERVGASARLQALPYARPLKIKGVTVSFHPAGHILGSAQVRLEAGGHVTVVSGDYTLTADPACEPFEPVPCDTFISESTFGLPVYQWAEPRTVFQEISDWWRANQQEGLTSVLFAYALGKAQRLLASLDASVGPIAIHGSVARYLPHYAAAGVRLAPCETLTSENLRLVRGRGLVIAPGSVRDSPWLRKLEPASLAFASGWMAVRGTRRRRALDRGFVLSDHADWPGLLRAVALTRATSVGVTHGYAQPFARFLRENRRLDAFALATP